MQVRELETKNAGYYARAATINARVSSYAASTHYTQSQRTQAERVKIMLEEVYSGTVYLNYRKKFIAIKIETPRVRNSKLLRELETEYTLRGYSKIQTAQGITYRIPKEVDKCSR